VITSGVKLFVSLAAVVVLLTVTVAQADVITPVGVTASSGTAYAPDLISPLATQVPGTPTVFHTGGDVLTWTHDATWSGFGQWLGDDNTVNENPGAVDGQYLTFDLGAAHGLTNAYLWNFSQYRGSPTNTLDLTGRGVKNFDLLGSLDGATFTPIATGLQMAKSEVGLNDGASGGGTIGSVPITTQAFDISATARYVRVLIHSDWNGIATDNVGLAQVAFGGTAVTPEPGTLVLLASGLIGLLCYAWKNRK
jgi:hypothetical protein